MKKSINLWPFKNEKSKQWLWNVAWIDFQEDYFSKKLDERVWEYPTLIETLLGNIKTQISECCYFLSKEFSK